MKKTPKFRAGKKAKKKTFVRVSKERLNRHNHLIDRLRSKAKQYGPDSIWVEMLKDATKG